jgi:hypothetical protein
MHGCASQLSTELQQSTQPLQIRVLLNYLSLILAAERQCVALLILLGWVGRVHAVWVWTGVRVSPQQGHVVVPHAFFSSWCGCCGLCWLCAYGMLHVLLSRQSQTSFAGLCACDFTMLCLQ